MSIPLVFSAYYCILFRSVTKFVLSIYLLVSPALGNCIQDLRSSCSGVLIDFQHVCNEVITENSRLVEETNIQNTHIAEIEDSNHRLDQTLSRLNEVINLSHPWKFLFFIAIFYVE